MKISLGATPSLHTKLVAITNPSNQQPFLEHWSSRFHSPVSLKIAPGHIICYLITCWLVTVGQVSGAVETPLDSECPWETIIG